MNLPWASHFAPERSLAQCGDASAWHERPHRDWACRDSISVVGRLVAQSADNPRDWLLVDPCLAGTTAPLRAGGVPFTSDRCVTFGAPALRWCQT